MKLLILDEPTAALNDDDSAHLLDLIDQLRAQGITCIIISHKLKEVLRIADRITIIRDGRTIETLDVHAGGVDEDRIIDAIRAVFDLRPAALVRDLDLLRPIYSSTATYGHFGRELPDFTWERLDRVDALRAAAGL